MIHVLCKIEKKKKKKKKKKKRAAKAVFLINILPQFQTFPNFTHLLPNSSFFTHTSFAFPFFLPSFGPSKKQGEAGLGKSTLINSLFMTEIYSEADYSPAGTSPNVLLCSCSKEMCSIDRNSGTMPMIFMFSNL